MNLPSPARTTLLTLLERTELLLTVVSGGHIALQLIVFPISRYGGGLAQGIEDFIGLGFLLDRGYEGRSFAGLLAVALNYVAVLGLIGGVRQLKKPARPAGQVPPVWGVAVSGSTPASPPPPPSSSSNLPPSTSTSTPPPPPPPPAPTGRETSTD